MGRCLLFPLSFTWFDWFVLFPPVDFNRDGRCVLLLLHDSIWALSLSLSLGNRTMRFSLHFSGFLYGGVCVSSLRPMRCGQTGDRVQNVIPERNVSRPTAVNCVHTDIAAAAAASLSSANCYYYYLLLLSSRLLPSSLPFPPLSSHSYFLLSLLPFPLLTLTRTTWSETT